MSENKRKWHPEPWKTNIESLDGGEHTVVYVACDCDDFSCLWAGDATYDMDVATANLISAAPDLYAVVEELEESSSYWSEYYVPLGIVERIQAALRKARGCK